MAFVTKVSYTGNGSLKEYTVTFPYLRKGDVYVYVGGVLSTAYGWLTDTQIQFTTAPANGAAILIKRDTNIDEPTVDYADASTLTEKDLDASHRQEIYKLQEIVDAQAAQNTVIENITVEAGNLPPVGDSPDGTVLMIIDGEWGKYEPEAVTLVEQVGVDGDEMKLQVRTRQFYALIPGGIGDWETIHTGTACPEE